MTRERLDERGQQSFDAIQADIRAGRMLAGLYGPVGIRLWSPRVSDATLQGNLYLRFDSRIGRRTYEIAVLTTARELDHQFEWTAHEPAALKAGVEPVVIETIKRRAALAALSAADRLVIQIGREVLSNRMVALETFDEALRTFGETNLVDIVSVIADYAGTAGAAERLRSAAPGRAGRLAAGPIDRPARRSVALVVLLRGVNVGGHRSFRPAALAGQLQHLGAVNIGAAGTLRDPEARRPGATARGVRPAPAVRLADCRVPRPVTLVRLLSHETFDGLSGAAHQVRFISVLSEPVRKTPPLPVHSAVRGPVAGQGPRAPGTAGARPVYRRHMKVIGYLGKLDRLFGVPVTTRNWNTLAAIAKVLDAARSAPRAGNGWHGIHRERGADGADHRSWIRMTACQGRRPLPDGRGPWRGTIAPIDIA